MAALTFSAFFSLKWEIMGTLKKRGPFGDPKSEKGPHGDPGPQMGTHLGAVDIAIFRKYHDILMIFSVFDNG